MPGPSPGMTKRERADDRVRSPPRRRRRSSPGPARGRAERILVLDGAMGTEIQALELVGSRFPRRALRGLHGHDLKGNNDLLILTQPDAIARDPPRTISAPAPTSSRPTPSPAPRSPRPITAWRRSSTSSTARARGSRARPRVAAEKEDGRRRFVAGALGPTNRTLSISPDVNNPGFRAVTFDQVRDAYAEQVRGLVDGGAEIILIETIFDTLNAKAAIFADAAGLRRARRRRCRS